jgi:DNA polymerase III epsilon subunit-like protein
MLSLGVVAVKERQDGQMLLSEPLYLELRPTGAGVDPGAMAVNGLDLAALRESGLRLPEALEALTAFVEGELLEGTKPVFVGHNAPFDWSFVSYSYTACGMENPFGYKALDTKALASGVLGLHWFDSNKERLAELLSLPEVATEKVHRADYDAWYQAHILVQLLKRGQSCVDS